MWFLGAGASRTSGMPTATDLLWDLKRKYYCATENQKIENHDVDKRIVRNKIQSYLDGKGFPPSFSPDEYSFYFDLIFSDDRAAQQKYIFEQLAPNKINLNFGQRALAALLASRRSRVIFSTNFDEVVETAYSRITGRVLHPFHLEGPYAALTALNAEQFPLYAKLHGDFRYQSIKNLPEDLKRNDEQIQKCFLAASTRFGVIVSGYSGRDSNVLEMFRTALNQNNAFPHGLIWTTIKRGELSNGVTDLIEYARSKGVMAYSIDIGTFDALFLKIWRQLPDKEAELDRLVSSGKCQSVSIDLKPAGKNYPVLRTNALPITSLPSKCGRVIIQSAIGFSDIIEKRKQSENLILTYTDQPLFWGDDDKIEGLFKVHGFKGIEGYTFSDAVREIASSGIIKSFFEEALVKSICTNRPLLLRRYNRTWYAIVDRKEIANSIFNRLKNAVGNKGGVGPIIGPVPGSAETKWAESVAIKLEERNGSLWLLLRPDIWIFPKTEREKSISFLKRRKISRRNTEAYSILNAWLEIFFGENIVGSHKEVETSFFPKSNYASQFRIMTRTAFSAQE